MAHSDSRSLKNSMTATAERGSKSSRVKMADVPRNYVTFKFGGGGGKMGKLSNVT